MSFISQDIFNAIKNGDLGYLLSHCEESMLRPIFPILTQFFLNDSLDESIDWKMKKEQFKLFLMSYSDINLIKDKLEVDFIKLASHINEQVKSRFINFLIF